MKKDRNQFPEIFAALTLFITIPISLLGELFFDYETNPLAVFFIVLVFAVMFERQLKKLLNKIINWLLPPINNQP